MSAILEVHNLVKRFGGLAALDDASLKLERGEILGLLGPNGAGKTVLQSCIAGAQPVDAGKIYFDGQDVTDWPAEKMCHAGLGRTFQVPHPFPALSALDNVLVSATFGNPRRADGEPFEVARLCLEFVGFDAPLDSSPRALNTVMLKRLDLARALASSPRLLMLDEFAAGLITGELDAVSDLVRNVSELGVEAVIVVEHVLRPIRDICTRAVVLDRGRLIADGAVEEVMNDERVLEAYLGK